MAVRPINRFTKKSLALRHIGHEPEGAFSDAYKKLAGPERSIVQGIAEYGMSPAELAILLGCTRAHVLAVYSSCVVFLRRTHPKFPSAAK